jgi:hypothetical protein
MKAYIGTKIIHAMPLTRSGAEVLLKRDIGGKQTGDGYLVEYENGYQSWSPKDVFDKAYRAMVGMTFGLAIESLKNGLKVARAGWNGKGMFAYLVPANSYPAQTGAAKSYFGEGSVVPYRAYLALKTAQNDVATWAPSVSDVLAEDWEIVDSPAV